MKNGLPLKKKLALDLFAKYRANSKKIHQLDYIFWECTLRCNLNCLHCGSDCRREAQSPDMPISDFIKAIDNITPIIHPNKTMIVFTGGEPLQRNDLEKCGLELNRRGFPWGMVTNGLALTKTRLESLLSAGMHALTISLDGMEHSHNWLRGNPSSFKKAIESIELLSTYPNLRFDVVTCANPKNITELDTLRELLIDKQVKEWRLFTIFPTGRAKSDTALQLTPEQFKGLFDKIAAYRKESGIKVSYGCEGYLGRYEGEVRDNLFFCRAGITVASILADGSVSACPNINHAYIQGNIYQEDFRTIWEEKFDLYRNRDWMKKDKCRDCKSFKYCDGNGMHLRDENGELLVCHLNKLSEVSADFA